MSARKWPWPGSREHNREADDGLIDKLVTISRVAKVVEKGGRRFAFAALVVAGDQKGPRWLGPWQKAREVAGYPQGDWSVPSAA